MVVATACCAALITTAGARGGGGSVKKPGRHAFVAPSASTEVVSLRTATSRTYRRADGSLRAMVSADAVNFRNANGAWQAIDTHLKPDGVGGLRTAAAPTTVALPRTLDAPTKVMTANGWVSFALVGARRDAAAPRVSGASATYPDALAGVDVDYATHPSGVKETLTLTSRRAPSTYHFRLSASAGLAPSLRPDGSLVFRTRGGTVRFHVPAPTVQAARQRHPSTGHANYRLDADGRRLTLAVDPRWLKSARYPVEVDPSVWAGATDSCTLASGSLASTTDCNGEWLKVGNDATHTYRAALRFGDLDAVVPQTATIIRSQLALTFPSQSTPAAVTRVDAIGLGQPLATGATWSTYDGTHPWSQTGGTTVLKPQSNPMTLYPEFMPDWVTFDIGKLTERWVRDPSANNGVLLRAHDEEADNVVTLGGATYANGGPTIAIDYQLRSGHEPGQTYEKVAIDDTSDLSVNVTSGNVAVEGRDVRLPGVGGLDLEVSRTFNGQRLGDASSIFGSAWTDSINGAGFLNGRVWYDDARWIVADGGAVYRFDRDYDNDTEDTHAFVTPSGIDADLTVDQDTGIGTLAFRDTGRVWTYAASVDGETFTLSQIADAAGHHIDITPAGDDPSKPGSITDTHGDTLTFTRDLDGYLTRITDEDDRHWDYTYTTNQGHKVLSGVTDPESNATSYVSATDVPGVWDKLERVVDRDGHGIDIEYGPDGDWSQATKITRAVDGDPDHDRVWKFDYTPDGNVGHACDATVDGDAVIGRTVETDPDDHEMTYCYNNEGEVIQSFGVDRVAPGLVTDPHAVASGDIGAVYVSWTPGEDPDLPSGSPGSGVASYAFRVRPDGGAWSGWTTTTESGAELDGFDPGDPLDLEVASYDAAGNGPTIDGSGEPDGPTVVASLVVSLLVCAPTQDTTPYGDGPGAALPGAPATTPVADEFTFARPLSATDLETALPPGAEVLAVRELFDEGSGEVTESAITMDEDLTLDENLEVAADFLLSDAEQQRDELSDMVGAASGAELSALTAQLAAVDARLESFDDAEGVPLGGVSLVHDDDISDDFTLALGNDLGLLELSVPPTCDPGGGGSGARTARAKAKAAVKARAARDTGEFHGIEHDVRRNSYSPPQIRVGTDTRVKVTQSSRSVRYSKASASWQWKNPANRSYWSDAQRSYDAGEPSKRYNKFRGFEVQLDLDLDSAGGPFGRPLWGTGAPSKADTHGSKGIPNVWTANFPCAYPDDYFGDDLARGYSLTIGSYCRPTSDRKLYRWAHILQAVDGDDHMRPSVTPVHMRNPNYRSGIKLPVVGILGPSELDYCNVYRKGQAGACMFTDNIPGLSGQQYRRRVDGNGNVLIANPAGHASAAFARTATARSASVRPSPNTPPTISGTPAPDETLTATPGTWDPEPEELGYRWCRIPAGEVAGCETIAGETGATYEVQAGDVDAKIEVMVFDADHPDTGSFSDPVTINEESGAPVALVAPSLDCLTPWRTGGTNTCQVEHGTWSGSPTLTFIAKYCVSADISCPVPETSDDHANVIWTPNHPCFDVAWEATVVARNAYGTVVYPLRGPSDYVCLN